MKSIILSAMMFLVLPIPRILPVGYRFYPTDIELIRYLVMLLRGFYSHDMPIGVVDFWELEPGELPGWSRIKSDDQIWHFFSKRVPYATKNKRMFKRKTRAGYWKPTGESTSIDDLGKRTTLRFYKDLPKAEKTEWIAYEYEITQSSTLSNPDEFVIIKLMKSSGEKRTNTKTKMCKLKSEEMSTSSYDQNQSLNVVTASDCCNHEVPADSGDQEVGNMTTMSTYSISHQSNQMASACEMMNTASCNSHEVVPSDFKNQNTAGMSAMSTHDIGEQSSRVTSSSLNHSSVTEVQECGYFPNRASSHIPQNQEENEQSNCLVASDFKNKKLPSEVEDSPPKATTCTENQPTPDETNPSCSVTLRVEDHIQNEEFDFSFLEDDDLCSLMDLDVDNEPNETFPEIDDGVLAELEAFNELQNDLNS